MDGRLNQKKSAVWTNASSSQITPPQFVRFSLGTHLYSWMEKGTVGVECLAQEHNSVSRTGVEPGPLDPGTGAVTMRPPCLLERLCHVRNRAIATNTKLILNDGMFSYFYLKRSYNMINF